METLTLGLLVVALLLFLVSTRQLALWLRAAIVFGGIVALVWSTAIVATMEGHYGLFRVAADAWNHMGTFDDSVLMIALQRNEASVEQHILPLLDLLLIVGGAIGMLTAVALTPGESVERIVRPMIFMLLGLVFGAALALSIVAVGFGGPVDQREYANLGSADNAYDGDTFWLGETSFRLYGVDAPERTQSCATGDECGRMATDRLGQLIEGRLVRCSVKENAEGNVTESFGRPLVTCEVRDGDQRFDLAERMIEDGFAIVYRGMEPDVPQYVAAELRARQSGANLQAQCWMNPKTWRSRGGRVLRDAFIAREFQRIPTAELIGGGCPPLNSDSRR